jgi:hypothetical protein
MFRPTDSQVRHMHLSLTDLPNTSSHTSSHPAEVPLRIEKVI